jgi:Nif-specific regulatory protein
MERPDPSARDTDVRLIIALKAGIEFKDLFGRSEPEWNLCVAHIPPLRERREDIRPIVDYLVQKSLKEQGRRPVFTESAMDALERHDWPGNIREMQNLIERLALPAGADVTDVRRLAPYLTESPSDVDPEQSVLDSLKEIERRGVISALEKNNWVQSRAARDLGITLRQMGYRVRKYGLEEMLKQKKAPGEQAVG